jgi:hypothetical protein
VAAGLDQFIGRQRVYADAQVNAYRYQDNDELNNHGYRLSAGLDWATVERASGTLRVFTRDTLARFSGVGAAQIPVAANNREELDQIDGTVLLGRVTRLRGELGFGWRQLRYSAPEYDRSENDQDYFSAGLRYRPGGSSTVGAGFRRTSGEYPRRDVDANGNPVAEVYDRNDFYVDADWTPSGASKLFARLFYGSTEYETFSQRDFSGLTGEVGWDWQPTGKISVRTRLSQFTGADGYLYDDGPDFGIADNSRTTTTLRLNATYEVTAKVRAYGGGSYARRDLVNRLFAADGAVITLSGVDYPWTLNAGLSWAPRHWAVLSCDATSQGRDGVPGLERPFSNTRVGCYAQFLLR